MQLDVLIPTYNRQELLPRTLQSLLEANPPAGLNVHITVIDNNSKDHTRQLVQAWMPRFAGRLHYRFEAQQGRSCALNKGIRSTRGDLVGMIDDDEAIDANWYHTVFAAFQNPEVDFIGGPYHPSWGAPCPVWLPKQYVGVIGWIDGGTEVRPFDHSYPGILMGGNAVLRRSLLNQVGLYLTSLGRTDKHLLAGEDEDMYERLLKAGARGLYRPDLIIYHYIPPQRLTRGYFRRWCFWRGVSMGFLRREQKPAANIVELGGVPRYLYGAAWRGLLKKLAEALCLRKNSAAGFAGELALWDVAGFFYGRHFYRPAVDAKPANEMEVMSSV
ncbi:MAG: glycosyltransferase family 2 protein [Acidobacteria bacterium]|nr:glycosyltransferase family 2 protein [Acidobacteriota bacterium]